MAGIFGAGALAAIERKKAGTYAMLQSYAGRMEAEARGGAPWADRTGHARQGLHAGVERQANGIWLLWLAHSQQYGLWLEKGTGIHGPAGRMFAIKPKFKKALFWPGAKHPVKSVVSPGMAPRAIIGPTLENNIQPLRRDLQELWDA